MKSESENVYFRFFDKGEVVEIRGLGLRGNNNAWEGWPGGGGVVSGYFDNAVDFERASNSLDEAGARGVYFTLNPVIPDLLARRVNRLVASPKSTTDDTHILCLRWLPIDIDPVRPSDLSSSEDELKKAAEVARKITEWLEGEIGFKKGLRACSGNGYHLCYRLPDLPNDEAHRRLIQNGIRAIASRFTDAHVDIDVKVGNPARIWKCYGTVSRKGDHTETRPHRKSFLFEGQPKRLDDVPL
jgi:hypothetical protein